MSEASKFVKIPRQWNIKPLRTIEIQDTRVTVWIYRVGAKYSYALVKRTDGELYGWRCVNTWTTEREAMNAGLAEGGREARPSFIPKAVIDYGKPANPHMFILARQLRGWDIEDVARMSGIDAARIEALETDGVVDKALLRTIAEGYEFPEAFFYRPGEILRDHTFICYSDDERPDAT